jgi:ketosteroid isomerase-like protein
MVPLTLVLQLSLAATRLSAAGVAPEEVKAKLELEELEKRWLAAANDAEALKVILAEDFVLVSPEGPIGKEQWITQVKQHRAAARNESRRFDDLRVRIYGEVAVVNGTIVGTNLSRNTTDKMAFTDVFTYRDGRWQAVNSQQTAMNLPASK